MSHKLRALALQLTLNEAASARLEELIAADHAQLVCPQHPAESLAIDGSCRTCEQEAATMRRTPEWVRRDNAKVLGPQ